jgi:hypothetical protein
VQDQHPQQARDFDDPVVTEELAQVAAHRSRGRGVGRSEVAIQDGGARGLPVGEGGFRRESGVGHAVFSRTYAGRAKIRAIGLDLDDTLWPIWPTIERAEDQLHQWLLPQAPGAARMIHDARQRLALRDALVRERPRPRA